jgi:hypothetical protein
MYKRNNTMLTALGLSLLLGTGAALADNTQAAAASTAAAAPAAAAPAAATPAAAAKPAAKASANKLTFTSAVNNHEPADDLSTLDNSHTRIFFYAVLNNAQDQEITFRWSYNGVTQAEVKQTPKYPHFRTYTSKELDPSKLGTWTVEILDADGNSLGKKTFEYTKADAAAATPAPAASTKK